MIINCRPSTSNEFIKFTVIWDSTETVNFIRYSLKQKVEKRKSFDKFADANGFALGLQNRGLYVKEIVEELYGLAAEIVANSR